MDKTRLWIIGSAVAMVAIVALGWVVGVQPQLTAASAADAQTAEVQALNQKNAIVLATLQKQYKDLPALKEKLAGLTSSVPADVQMPAFIDELTAIAGANGVIFTKWTAADGQAYTPVEAPAAPAQAPAAASTDSSTPAATPTPTPAPTAPVQVAGVPPVVSSLITAENFTATPVTVTVNGPYANVLGFLKGTQSGQRLFLVTGFVTKESSTGPGVDGTVSGFIYTLKPANTTPAGK
ncbi:hypothetical protein [Leifsonia sp. NPDC058230]|uniref:hypothetical protein n=1 Tax=Leifsonia sp. NPDC058230 TaxID=3346391 RepID=UPI0036D97705